MADEQPPELDDEVLVFAARMFDLARSGDTAALAAYVDAGLPVNLTNAKGDSLLMLAAYYDHPETVQALLERGADTGRVNDPGQTALSAAVLPRSADGAGVWRGAGSAPGPPGRPFCPGPRWRLSPPPPLPPPPPPPPGPGLRGCAPDAIRPPARRRPHHRGTPLRQWRRAAGRGRCAAPRPRGRPASCWPGARGRRCAACRPRPPRPARRPCRGTPAGGRSRCGPARCARPGPGPGPPPPGSTTGRRGRRGWRRSG